MLCRRRWQSASPCLQGCTGVCSGPRANAAETPPRRNQLNSGHEQPQGRLRCPKTPSKCSKELLRHGKALQNASKTSYERFVAAFLFTSGGQFKAKNYFGVDLHHQNYENINISIICRGGTSTISTIFK